ncbi:GntR family transcriptional regulator [Citrobacter koseri]|uniref:GntR family transcriptional regulator n=1 Tax=Citrobacter koseri TaxID=545 RepID=A0A2X2WMR2_CITKO|nr:GntR family transcriptional regulator [Citrobacter koseri]
MYVQKKRSLRLPFSPEKARRPIHFKWDYLRWIFSRVRFWARVMGRRLRTQTRFDLALGDVCGEAVLREAIVDYLRVSRSIECLPEQVFITSGYASSMTLILRALAKPGEGMWVEDPGFPLIRPVIAQENVGLMPVPVDDHGLNVAAGIHDYPQARFVLLTPAHQSRSAWRSL